ncbi:MAG TPA: hypothetical protein VHL14_03850, partial [Steroidobacteraceae bacterium]|nr:hypothetical protein [Steroidobacteraceae bacterium]
INSIQGGGLIGTVLANEKEGEEAGWYWQLRNLPDAPETRYLYDLLASNAFQEALKNFRDLRVMRHNLEEWLQNLDAFQNMVDTRKIAYERRTEAMKKVLDDVDMDGLENKVLDFDTRLKEIERNEDVVSLATATEQEAWQRVMRVKEAAEQNASGDPQAIEQMDKIRLMKGVLYWNMSASFKARLWREQKEVRELAVATKEARRRYTLVGRARDTVPQRNEEFARRVQELTPRLQAMLGRCLDTDQAQSDYLARLASTQLQQQKDRLSQYTLQAQYALASIYDRAADAQRPAAKVAAPSSSDATATPEHVAPEAGDAATSGVEPADAGGEIDLSDDSSKAGGAATEPTPATDAPASPSPVSPSTDEEPAAPSTGAAK